jgi:S-adenosylmethionine:tRNA ribosyltransferase-isomerase
MRTSDFDFTFPEHLIAAEPLPRGESRMLVLTRAGSAAPSHRHSRDLPEYLAPGDVLVLNDTKVLKARLLGETPTGQKAEILLLAPRPEADGPGMRWEAMVKPAKRFRIGDRVRFSPALEAEVVGIYDGGTRLLSFDLGPEAFHKELEVTGKIPLPPYIRREATAADEATYQPVFAAKAGSVAAPTASLHFDQALLDRVAAKGVEIRKVTLHVGAGTFKPVQSEDLDGHVMHSEWFDLPAETAAAIEAARARGNKVFAVGTTVARVLETCAARGPLAAASGETRIFIKPGHAWKAVDGLLTNFHWPKSTLFMLVCSLLGTERAKAVYEEAFKQGYRLFSYGDAMLIAP